MRLDKWLWAARFFKTRSLAAQAIAGGKVKVDGTRAKPARTIRPGDRLTIHIGAYEWLVEVVALAPQRGPAPVAQALYREDAASLAGRQAQIAERCAQEAAQGTAHGRPTKRDRRMIRRFVEA
jgi:ribosome-associated heat shock protein Hsp15